MHSTVSSPDDLCQNLRRWTQKKYSRYAVGYLALHGYEGCVKVGRKSISLADLGVALAGLCTGKTIYFGSCSTFNIEQQDIRAFAKTTKAKCIAGYTKDVDWIEAAAFELLMFDCLSYYKRSDAVERWLRTEQEHLVDRLGFEMYYGKALRS